ncbi:hypothetical protein [Citreimonas salinaria]|uniref:Uncharacterized protein n=1 Tax=Citreimonas salinaria TaxID=321339 RepID=A0A1H3LMV5_9RHOB|nr:hypothetical protein [Citreimonas salinaria]SDY65175.1 hypothetical protein SAMN05444340_11379 [Citreimonas salinaria]
MATEKLTENAFTRAGENVHDLKECEVIPLDEYREKIRAHVPKTSLNDAEIIGTESDGFEEFLNRKATFLLGEMWGARDRRNTQDGQWSPTELTWGQWIAGQPGNRKKPAWGFSRHPIGRYKAGSCIVLGSSVEGARKAKAMDTMFAMGLDVDSGASLGETLEKLQELGVFCLVYSSYNHGKRGIELKRDDVLRKLQIARDPTDEEVRQYLRAHDKNRYEDSFVDAVTIADQKHQTAGGVKIVLDTPPLDKFRLIFPLAEPVKLIDLGDTQDGALAVWEDKVTGLARNVLGVHFDTSCTDPSRLFYTARHPKGAEWYAAIVQGAPLSFDGIKPMRKSAYTGNRDLNAFTMAGGQGDERPQCVTPSGKSLNDWHSDGGKNRFMLADLMETLCPDKIRHSGGEASGHVHTECPFEHEHGSEGGTATMAINCLDSQNEYWTWFCHHDACQGRHKLQFLEEALRAGWFEERALYDVDQGFMLEVADGETDPFAPLPGAIGDETKTPEERAQAFDTTHSQADIEKFIKALFREGVDLTTQANVTAILAKVTNLGKRELKKFWKELEDEKRKAERAKKRDDQPTGIFITEPAPVLTQYALNCIKTANDAAPFLFEYIEKPTIVRRGRLMTLDPDGKRHQLGKVATFLRPTGDELQHIYPPWDVVNDVFASDLKDFTLPLRGVVDTPFFAADGALVTSNGYHAGSQIFLDSELVLAGVSAHPTREEAQDAARFIVEECLADFPLGGLSRQEIMDQTFTESGVPAVANTLAFILLPFARTMIHGPTPGHVINKPAPGTGAGFLVDVCTTISSGAPAPALAMPKNADELAKTLGAVLMDGEAVIFFDNINHEMDSPDLASAMTSPHTGFKLRILGKTQTALVRVLTSWAFAANTLTMSPELLRRCILIDLDRKAVDPEKYVPEGGWRHRDVREWTRNSRAKLVHACLTIIQRWVAEGMTRSEDTLASFENWAGIMGGILAASGVGGFMGNQSALTDLSDGRDDELAHVVQAVAQAMHGIDGARLFIGSKTDEETAKGRFGLFDLLHAMDETPRLDQWGYRETFTGDGVEVEYHNTRKAGVRFKAAAKRTYRVTLGGVAYSARFEQEHDGHANAKCYRLDLTPQ